MATLSLNTSITSTHKSDFYTGIYNDGKYDWVVILNLYGNYFTDFGSPVPCEDMVMYARTQISQNWKELGRGNMCGYDGYCYLYLAWAYGYWYKSSNPSDPDNLQFYDKLRVNYGGMSAESFVNRTNLNIHTVDALNNIISEASITVSCAPLCDNYQWTDKITTSDNNGNATVTFFNPPVLTYNPRGYHLYRITATKGTLSGYKNVTIPNQQYYPSESTFVNVQLSCPTNLQCNLVVT